MQNRRLAMFAMVALAVALFALACDDGGVTDGDGDTPECVTTNDCAIGYECIGEECICTQQGGCDADGDVEGVIYCDSDYQCPSGQTCQYDAVKDADICKPGEDGDTDSVDGDGIEDGDIIDPRPKCAEMRVGPDEVNFGAVNVGNNSKRQFEIINDSNFNVDLEIYTLDYSTVAYGEEFAITGGPAPEEFPIILGRGQSLVIEVTYTPLDGGIDEGFISVVSNACEGSIVQVRMFSEYKGTSYVDVDPESYSFGEVNLGSELPTHDFTITNIGDPTGNKVAIISEISFAEGYNENFSIIAGHIDALNPVQLTPCPNGQVIDECSHVFTVQYNPQTPADVFDKHRGRILIVHQSDDDVPLHEVNVDGMATADLLEINPVPVDFGTTVIHEYQNPDPTCEKDEDCPNDQVCAPYYPPRQTTEKFCWAERTVHIHNYNSSDVAIKGLDLMQNEGDTGCENFDVEDFQSPPCVEDADCPGEMVCGDYLDSRVCFIPAGGQDYAEFVMRYSPREIDIDTCTLRIQSTLPQAAEFLPFPVRGKGRLPNECPTARMALDSHATPISRPIEGIEEGTTLCFYGNVSEDPDGELCGFQWWLDPVPNNSLAQIRYLDQRHSAICVDFDRAGDYGVNLKVQDCEGCWSETETGEVLINGDQWLQIILKFSSGGGFIGQNLVDLDLGMQDELGGSCSDDNLSSNNTCQFPDGNGTVIMPTFSMGAGTTGTTEELRLTYPQDGVYYIFVEYEDDCQDWYDFLIVPFCASREQPNNYTMEIYDPKDLSTPRIPLYDVIRRAIAEKGSRHSWRILRVDGVWTELTQID